MAVTTKKTFPATSNATTTAFSPVGIELNNQDDLDVYITEAAGTRVLQLRQSSASTSDGTHPQVNDTTGLYFPPIASGTALKNYTLSADNNTITFNSALPSGAVVTAERRTRDASGTYQSFSGGSTIRSTELNKAFDEARFTAQEARNKTFDIERQVLNYSDGNIRVLEDKGLYFEGATDNANEINLAAADPTADRTITLPDQSGNVLVSGNASIVNADISTSAEIAVSKLADGAARQVLQTAANGNDVEWTSNVDVPGTLDVTGATDLDGTLNVDGAATLGSTLNVTGTITGNLTGNVTGNITGNITGNTTGNVTGNADTATTLQTPRTIGGVSFNGSANINLPGVNTAGTQDTSGNAATATLAATATDLAAATKISNSEQASATANDTTYFTTQASDARYFRQDSTETIESGDTWSGGDTRIATTGAIDNRIIDLVDDVGGFWPIANETSFPTANPDVNNGAGTIVSIKTIASSRTPSSGTVTIANGAGSGNTVTITGCGSTVLAAGFGCLVETTTTLHTYAFHRLSPKATEVTTVSGSIANVNTCATNIANINTVASDLNETTSEIDVCATNIANVNTVGGAITNVNAVATNISGVHHYADVYQVGTSAPTQRVDGGSLTAGDMWFDSSSNKELKVHNGTAYQLVTPAQSVLDDIAIVSGNITYAEDLGNIIDAVSTGTGNSIETCADNIAKIQALGAADAIADMNTLGTADVVNDMNVLGTSSNVTNMNTLANIHANITTVAGISANVTTVATNNANVTTTAGSIANVNTAAGSIANVNTVAGSIGNVNTVGGSQSNVNTVASSIADVNRYANEYKIAASTPGSPSEGDLWYNTSGNTLNYYNSSSWVGISPGISAIVSDSSPQLGGHLNANSKNITNGGTATFSSFVGTLTGTATGLAGTPNITVGTVDGTNLQMDFGTI